MLLFQIEAAEVTTKAPDMLSFITWNVDGLDDRNLPKRTSYIIGQIMHLKPDVVFMQEVIDTTVDMFERGLVDYHILQQTSSAYGSPMDYYTCVMLRRTTVYLDSAETKPYDNSRMGRALQVVNAHIGQVKLCLLNTHLESTKEFSDQRVVQFKQCLDEMRRAKDDVTVIMAGDLNIRDSEVTKVGGLPPKVDDVWQLLGSKKELQYTWDCSRNTNLQMPGKFKPKMRFDRVLVRESNPNNVKVKTFNLIGIEKVPGTQSFPSDHWGILTTFKLRN
jgi:tyrosyl-DNA phosphodiesterase 2